MKAFDTPQANFVQPVSTTTYETPVYAVPLQGMVHSGSTGSLTGMTGAGGFRYVSQTPSTGSLTGMVHSGSNGSLNGLHNVSSTNSLPQVNSSGSLTSMPMQQMPQQQAWFGNFTNMIFTSDTTSPRQTNPGPIYCFDNPAQQKAAQQAAKPDSKKNENAESARNAGPQMTVTSPSDSKEFTMPAPYNASVTPRQGTPGGMSLFLGGFPVVSPHGVMAPVQQVMVSPSSQMQSFTPDNNMTGMPRSDSSVSLNSLPSQHSDDGTPIATQLSLASSDGGSGGIPYFYQAPQHHQFQANYQPNYQANYQPQPQHQQYQNSNPNYSHYQHQQPKGNNTYYQQYQDNQNFHQQQYQNPHQWNRQPNHRKDHDSRRDNRAQNFRQQNNANYRQRRNRRSKHQPPRFNDPEACKFCRTKQKHLRFKKKYSVGDIRAILQCRHVDENMVPETFGERWDVSEFFQIVDFFDVSRLNEFEYFKVPRTHTDENEVVNSHTSSPMLIEIFGRQLGFRRNQIPKRFKQVSIHDVSGCDARTAVRNSISEGLQGGAKKYKIPVNFQEKLVRMLHRYVGCLPLVDLCGETLPDLWTGYADSKVEGNPNALLRWTY